MTALWLGLALLLWPLARTARGRIEVLVGSGRLASAVAARRQVPLPGPGPIALGAAVVAMPPALWSLPVGIAVGVVAALAATVAVDAVRTRRVQARRSATVAGLALLGAELKAGASLDAALRASPHSGLAALKGTPAPDADLQSLAAALSISERTGAPVAEIVERLEADLRAVRDRDRVVATVLAGPRSSSLLLALLPVVGVVLGAAMGARPLDVLFGSPAGRGLLGAGVVLDALGVLWTRRLVRSAERG